MSATLTVHVELDSYPVDLTLDGFSGNELLKLWPTIRDGLTGLGARPAAPASEPAAGNGEPTATAPAHPRLPDGTPDPAWCPIHGVAMKRRTGTRVVSSQRQAVCVNTQGRCTNEHRARRRL